MSSNPAATPQPAPTGDGQEVLPELLAHIDEPPYTEPQSIVIALDLIDVIGFELFGKEWCEAKIKADLIARQEAGMAEYGTPLKTNNGRDALMDAYQESLDLLMYLKQWMMER